MESHSLKGKVYRLFEVEQKTEKFRKREIIIETNTSNERGTFIEYLKLQATQNRCDELNGIGIGDMVVVRWALAGRKWGKKPDEKFFTNVELLDINVITRAEGRPVDDVIEEALPLGPDDTLFEVSKDEIPGDGLDDLTDILF